MCVWVGGGAGEGGVATRFSSEPLCTTTVGKTASKVTVIVFMLE